MRDIDGFVQEFWQISESSGGVVGISFTPLRCLLKVLQVCLVIFSFTKLCFADKNQQELASPDPGWHHLFTWSLRIDKTEPQHFRASFDKLCRVFDEFLKMIDQSFFKSTESTGPMKCVIKSTIEPLRLLEGSGYILEDYLSVSQNRDCSQFYYCDSLHHILICRHFLSLLDGFNASANLQS